MKPNAISRSPARWPEEEPAATPPPAPRSEGAERRKLLVFDTAFTLEAIRERGLEESVTCRDLDGYFEHVWSVHPFATLLTSDSWGPRYGLPSSYELNAVHTVIEGKMGRFAALRWLLPLNFLLAQIGLFLFLKMLIGREKISLIRVSSPLYVGLFGWALSRLCGIPLVIRVGGNHDKIYEATGIPIEPRIMRSRRLEKMIERFTFRRADLVAGANEDNLGFALANGAREEFTTVFRYGNLIDPRHFLAPGHRQHNAMDFLADGLESKPFILYIGRLEAAKQPDHVVRVLAELRRRGHDIKAVITGDGRLRDEVTRLAEELGVGSELLLPGNQTQERLAALIPAAAVVVSPHTGRALAEAALGGAAIVAYDVDWQGELIKTGETGILVPNLDWRQMSDGVERMLTDHAFADAMKRSARERALEMLDPAALNQHERAKYSELLERFRSGRSR